MNFEKTHFSKSIGTLLLENLCPEDVETLKRVLQGKKAQYNEANSLLTSVLRALDDQNEKEEPEFEVTNLEIAGDNFSQERNQQDQQQNQIESNQSADSQPGRSTPSQDRVDSKDPKNRWEGVCKFYRNGVANSEKNAGSSIQTSV